MKPGAGQGDFVPKRRVPLGLKAALICLGLLMLGGILLYCVYLGWDFLSRQNNREKIGDIIGMVWFGCIYFPLFLRK